MNFTKYNSRAHHLAMQINPFSLRIFVAPDQKLKLKKLSGGRSSALLPVSDERFFACRKLSVLSFSKWSANTLNRR